MTPGPYLPTFDAVLLAGGAGRRLGGVDKAGLMLGGERLVDRTAAAARRAGAERIVVVGPESAAAPGSTTLREDPPGSGPLAAVAAGLGAIGAPYVLLLPCDLQRPVAVCAVLAGELTRLADHDGVLLRDESGRAQWLSGVYSAAALRSALADIENGGRDQPLRLLFRDLHLFEVTVADDLAADIDTPDDLYRARAEIVD